MFSASPVAADVDYAIIGSGLAGLQLALRLTEEKAFKYQKIALIDPDQKKQNDRTWCFWERGNGRWDAILHKSWNYAEIYAEGEYRQIDLSPYTYKMIRGIDFYNHCLQKLESSYNIELIRDEVQAVKQQEKFLIEGKKGRYAAHKVFDSRLPKEFFKDDCYTRIIQHFKGYRIKTNTAVFDPESLRLMDYRLKYKDTTSFFYVLPFSPTEALVEFTFFTPFRVNSKLYDQYLEKYITHFLKIDRYEIEETETGEIPMTDFPFREYSDQNLIKIGTAGGWVKPSSGYAFKNTENKIEILIQNLLEAKESPAPQSKWRFRWYDAVFLKVLNENNDRGEWLFQRFFNHKPNIFFRFLDEKSTLAEEFKIISSLYSKAFIKAAMTILFRKPT